MDVKRLNIGCGNDYRLGWTNLDIDLSYKADVYRDIEQGLPFDDEKFDEILIDNVLEHMKDLVFVMREIHRVLKKDGVLNIIVPYFKHRNAFSDPNHVRFFTENSFTLWEKGDGRNNEVKCDFNYIRCDKRGDGELIFTMKK